MHYDITPPVARTSDHQTSWEAPKDIPVTLVQDNILTILEENEPAFIFGMTDDEIRRKYVEKHSRVPSEQSLRTRRKELVDKGLVMFSGFYGRMPGSRNKSQKWALTTGEEQ